MSEKKVREAINQFKAEVEAINNTWDSFLDYVKPSMAKNLELLETAIEALEKQLPKKVDAKEEYRDFNGSLLYYKGFCPNCGFITQSNRNKCCSCCTQMLDWSE